MGSRRRYEASELAAVRSAGQLLHRPRDASHPVAVAEALCGVQSQDLRHGRLALRARVAGLTALDVEYERSTERSLLHTWAMRTTLHLVATEDAPWLLPLFQPRIEAFAERRLAQLGLDARGQDRAMRVMGKALAGEGQCSRARLQEHLESAGIELKPMVRNHLIGLAVARGVGCFGPLEGGRPLVVAASEWLPATVPVPRAAGLAELARRYIGAFGPATDRDFAKWSGLPLGDVRAGLKAIGGELREVRVGETPAWAHRRPRRRPRRSVVRLLPAWDTYLMGYPDRSFLAEPGRWRRISDGGGGIAPVISVDGIARGIWRPGRRDEPIAAEAMPFEELDRDTAAAVEAEIADIARFEAQETGMARRGRGRQGVHTARATPARR